MNIIWAPIKGFEELYEISTSGQVRALEKTDLISMNNNILTNGFMWKDVKEVKVYG